jgi:peptidoglycan/xylan/chitin deacetylase (PgdA/CDA1 family)
MLFRIFKMLSIIISLLVGILFYLSQEDKVDRLIYQKYRNYRHHKLLRINLEDRKRTVKAISTRSFVCSRSNFKIPILAYHGILEEVDEDDDYSVSRENFNKQMEVLNRLGYETISTQDLIDCISGNDYLPKKPIMITFNNGRLDSVKNSNETLVKHGFKAVMFVTVEKQVEANGFFLTWRELNEMVKSGNWDVQTHGYRAHNEIEINESGEKGYFLNNLKFNLETGEIETFEAFTERVREDYALAKKILEEKIKDSQIIAYAYPYGDFGFGSKNIDTQVVEKFNKSEVFNHYSLAFVSGVVLLTRA